MLGRPIGSAANLMRTCFGYPAYSTEQISKMLTILRGYQNYIWIHELTKAEKAKGGKAQTPPTERGLAKRPSPCRSLA